MATLTVYPDAGSGGTTVDGYTVRQVGSSTFSDLRNGSGTSSVSNATEDLARIFADSTTDTWIIITRGIFTFDTSSLGASSTISSATISLDGVSSVDEFPETGYLNIYSASPASNNALVAADYSSLGTTAFSTGLPVASWTTNYNDFALDASGIANINKTGISGFGARIDFDADNNPPTWGDINDNIFFQWRSADTSGTAQDPKLTIEYTVSGAIKDPIGFGVVPFPR